ncbi:hypothetical protein KR100_01635 [Synechococcus sp. KORDI-100]|uniref:FluC/FEX family fluoride channel n=1 Tax=Synechococcus sp. KORDI-100 TaxID=1280380 RepID=UPI0004E07A21|nr:CrcB family protein [Synechococcus sp. KORDI-100]AII42109.1 hypothetical protein KR100_01635 [Synechococcus sp. KORDI-100]
MAGFGLDPVLVGLGAVPGALLRLRVVNHMEPIVPRKHWGTFIVNVVASFGLGLVMALQGSCGSATGITLLFGTGFFGSLSTFSSFAMELLNELQAHHWFGAAALALASLVFGLIAAALGYTIGSYA